ncbi:MBL fold metallo-hydrolase [uncultured Paludibaculum sp.]|uniref:MBL fold metallo-hydrolase n=1 Tax=uncultured Paludibaculum sp. TaxID=1765020 RepID=UPI002AAADF36|nr:MBL fold metallo-hydrolase [uncultured Paludibaculum sp.]
MKLTFWGAARTVTGSMHHLAVNGRRYLLDCGLYQGHRKEAQERNKHFPFSPSSIEAVLVSHAHIDHTGNLPSLVKGGFSGPIYATPATVDLSKSMLADSAHIQEKDALFVAKRLSRRRKIGQADDLEVIEPLYSVEDAQKTLEMFTEVKEHEVKEVSPGLAYTAYDAGHMLGSTAIAMDLQENERKVRLAFSGDVGRPNLPIIRDPDTMPPVDYLIMESTYGDRLHKDMGSAKDKLADAINRVSARGGKIIAPAFAVGRTQQLVLLIHELVLEHRIPGIPIFVDSPLAVNVTEAFRKHTELFDAETQNFVDNGHDPFGFNLLHYVREVSESKALNDLRGPCLILSASGMAEAGRILHHLRNNIEDPRNMVLITGFQAENTLGRKIVDKMPEVPIFGEPVRLRAEVVKLNELSGHADQNELLTWMKPMVKTLKKVFLVHGEPQQSEALAKMIRTLYDLPVEVPTRGQVFDL